MYLDYGCQIVGVTDAIFVTASVAELGKAQIPRLRVDVAKSRQHHATFSRSPIVLVMSTYYLPRLDSRGMAERG